VRVKVEGTPLVTRGSFHCVKDRPSSTHGLAAQQCVKDPDARHMIGTHPAGIDLGTVGVVPVPAWQWWTTFPYRETKSNNPT
jgi:hypothetical protein